ncbi:hypothetical protein P8452_01926 [Trifolium repens]|nr:hypothetical protein P8452_01926 [Trifolium repens]
MSFMSLLLKYHIFSLIFTIISFTKVSCLNFNFSTFQQNDANRLILLNNSYIQQSAIQVTPDNSKTSISNLSGRALYKDPFKIASFNTTFVLNITPETSLGGEGIAFILTSDPTLPQNSDGHWLGIVNASTNGTSRAAVLAVEFDTRKSSTEDGPNNHVGININSISSLKQASLSNTKVNLSSGLDVFIRIEYSNDVISVFGSMNETSNDSMEPLLVSPSLNLSSYLEQEVYVGFSASTSNYTELNCVKAWEFIGVDISDKINYLWILIIIPIVILMIIIGGLVFFFLYFQRKKNMEIEEDTYGGIEDQIQHSSMAPKKYQLKELMKATGGFSLQNKLGEGGFGTVYKGILGNNKEIAVKRVSKNSRQGYMAPETFLTGRATVETDVYGFGVLVLEVVCRKTPGNVYAQDDYKNSIVYWVWELYGKGEIVSAADKRISYEEEEVETVLVLGLACCHPNPNERPSMKTVLMVLNGEISPPNVPMERPAFVWPAMPSSFKHGEDSSLVNGTLTPFSQLSGR